MSTNARFRSDAPCISDIEPALVPGACSSRSSGVEGLLDPSRERVQTLISDLITVAGGIS